MTVADQIKILDRNIKQNEAQSDLGRKAAKISALSSTNLDKYEYLAGANLDLKPSTAEQATFEYSPLGKIFHKKLKEEDKKEEPLKRLKNIEDKSEERLNVIKNNTEKIKEVTDFVGEPLSVKARGLIGEIKIIQKVLITVNSKLQAVTKLRMILVITKHLKSYLETFNTEI